MPEQPPCLYVVRVKAGAEYCEEAIPVPADQYQSAFRDPVAAADHARQLHREFVRGSRPFTHPMGRNPFQFLLSESSSLPEPVFRDWLMDEGIEPPAPIDPCDPKPYRSPSMSDQVWAVEQANWERWWAELPPKRRKLEQKRQGEGLTRKAWQDWWETVVAGGLLTPTQLERVWHGLDKISFFEVIEVPARALLPTPARTAFAIVHAHWQYDDSFYCGANDPLAVYPTRAAAEAQLAEQRRAVRATGGVDDGGRNDLVIVELPLPPEG